MKSKAILSDAHIYSAFMFMIALSWHPSMHKCTAKYEYLIFQKSHFHNNYFAIHITMHASITLKNVFI